MRAKPWQLTPRLPLNELYRRALDEDPTIKDARGAFWWRSRPSLSALPGCSELGAAPVRDAVLVLLAFQLVRARNSEIKRCAARLYAISRLSDLSIHHDAHRSLVDPSSSQAMNSFSLLFATVVVPHRRFPPALALAPSLSFLLAPLSEPCQIPPDNRHQCVKKGRERVRTYESSFLALRSKEEGEESSPVASRGEGTSRSDSPGLL